VLVDLVAFEKCGVGEIPSTHRKVIAFATGDLRVEDTTHRLGDIATIVKFEDLFVVVEQPIETSPHLTPVDLWRARILGQVP